MFDSSSWSEWVLVRRLEMVRILARWCKGTKGFVDIFEQAVKALLRI
jgi:hypothetical protein